MTNIHFKKKLYSDIAQAVQDCNPEGWVGGEEREGGGGRWEEIKELSFTITPVLSKGTL